MKKILLTALLSLSLQSCIVVVDEQGQGYSSRTREVTYISPAPPPHIVTSYRYYDPYDVVWDSTINIIISSNYYIVDSDYNRGFIIVETYGRANDHFDCGGYRHSNYRFQTDEVAIRYTFNLSTSNSSTYLSIDSQGDAYWRGSYRQDGTYVSMEYGELARRGVRSTPCYSRGIYEHNFFNQVNNHIVIINRDYRGKSRTKYLKQQRKNRNRIIQNRRNQAQEIRKEQGRKGRLAEQGKRELRKENRIDRKKDKKKRLEQRKDRRNDIRENDRQRINQRKDKREDDKLYNERRLNQRDDKRETSQLSKRAPVNQKIKKRNEGKLAKRSTERLRNDRINDTRQVKREPIVQNKRVLQKNTIAKQQNRNIGNKLSKLKKGMKKQAVKRIFGKPQKSDKRGKKEILTYSNVRITLENNKVLSWKKR